MRIQNTEETIRWFRVTTYYFRNFQGSIFHIKTVHIFHARLGNNFFPLSLTYLWRFDKNQAQAVQIISLIKNSSVEVWHMFFSLKSSVADPDPHGSGTFAWIWNYSFGSRSSKKWKIICKKKLWLLDCLYYRTVVWNREWQIVVKILLFDWI